MQVNITLSDGSQPSFQVDDASATLTVSWTVKSPDGFNTQSYSQSFALAEVASVGFAADPAPAAAADPAPADTPEAAPVDPPAAADSASSSEPQASSDQSGSGTASTSDAQPQTDSAATPVAEAEADLADAEEKLGEIQ